VAGALLLLLALAQAAPSVPGAAKGDWQSFFENKNNFGH
jgi:hypothetical protein